MSRTLTHSATPAFVQQYLGALSKGVDVGQKSLSLVGQPAMFIDSGFAKPSKFTRVLAAAPAFLLAKPCRGRPRPFWYGARSTLSATCRLGSMATVACIGISADRVIRACHCRVCPAGPNSTALMRPRSNRRRFRSAPREPSRAA